MPLDVAEADAEGTVPRLVLVGADGTECLGEPVAGAADGWRVVAAHRAPGSPSALPEAPGGPLPAEDVRPPAEALQGPSEGVHVEGLRAEVGLPRDAAWAAAVATLGRGLAVAADYAHIAGPGRPSAP